jgi:hypothetical protein
VHGADVRFFLGKDQGGSEEIDESGDEVFLPCNDDYDSLPCKVQKMFQWALAHGYEQIFKMDDDCYVVPSRLLGTDYSKYDYVGNRRDANGPYPHPYASGFCYMLSARAARIVADAELTEDSMEDRHVGHVLMDAWRDNRSRLVFFDEKKFICCYPGIEDPRKLWMSPIGKNHSVFAQFPPDNMALLAFWYNIVFPREALAWQTYPKSR